MGIADRDWTREPENPRGFGPLTMKAILIIGLFATYLVQMAIANAGHSLWIGDHLAVSADGIRSLEIWQLLTYGLLHSGTGHLVWNLVFLYFFGSLVERRLGRLGMLRFFLAGIVAGGVLFVAVNLATGSPARAVGASGALMSCLVFAAVSAPHDRVLLFFMLPIPMWLLAAAYVGMDLLRAVEPGAGGVAWQAHLGGAILGWAWVARPWRRWTGRRGSARPVVVRTARPAPPPRLRERAAASARRERDEAEAARVDTLLDRIHAEGIDSLSEEEKAFLKRVSERYRS